MKSFDLDEIKRQLPSYLEKTGTRIFKRTDDLLTASCPIHKGTKPNFHAKRLPDGTWLWNCRSGCAGTGGSVIDLHADLCGLARGSRDAIAGVAEVLGIVSVGEALPRRDDPARRRQRQERADQEAARRREEKIRADLTAALQRKRGTLLAPYLSKNWRADLFDSSPANLEPEPSAQAQQLVAGLFPSDAVLWMGKVKDSGREEHRSHFLPASEWLEVDPLPPRIAGGTFQPGSFSRSAASLATAPFIVIESDDLIGHKPETDPEREENRRLCAALILLLRDRFHLKLRAVIDTGGKSLHAWFDRPSPQALSALSRLLDGLAIDHAVFNRSAIAPLRLPGCVHHTTGQTARLYYLEPLSLT